LGEYLSLYRAEGTALRARRGKLAPSHPSVTITFSLAFALFGRGKPSGESGAWLLGAAAVRDFALILKPMRVWQA